jgi:hypothetical protein
MIEKEYYAHLDNFVGVFTMLKAYFAGQFPQHGCRLEITYDEEVDMEGAKEVAATLNGNEVVIVIDVTGVRTTKNFTIEKLQNKRLRKFVKACLAESEQFRDTFDLFVGCPDPICLEDETNVYSKTTPFTFFFGIPVRGGDYNEGPVRCWVRDVEVASEALAFLVDQITANFDAEVVDKSALEIEEPINLFEEEE